MKVPGATLRYEVRGGGPVLLLVPGGAGDAGLYEAMAGPLVAAGFTVVSYDQRGLSRSPLDEPLDEPGAAAGAAKDQRVDEWREDARAVLAAVVPEGERAYVFGSSSGAIVALDLLAAHPDLLHRVVAHEPPLVELLADPSPYRAHFAEVRELLRGRGLGAAMARFGEAPDGRRPPAAPDGHDGGLPEAVRPMADRMAANMPVFLERVLCSFSSSAPDLDGLRAAAGRLVLGLGATTAAQSADATALTGPARRLAELTGAATVEFPGGHVGCVEHPAEFAALLARVLLARVLHAPAAP
ncbi:alpha/beta fold hydrolase [Streptomyces sp. NPDC090025]|uniref:alpha/beta fold hydrolase n=1 Tax=Streptomyces sp. NPDC090025 TaxID=3365922 RepID=UPI0038389FFC